jgi:hypothetical protein
LADQTPTDPAHGISVFFMVYPRGPRLQGTMARHAAKPATSGGQNTKRRGRNGCDQIPSKIRELLTFRGGAFSVTVKSTKKELSSHVQISRSLAADRFSCSMRRGIEPVERE